MSSNLTLSAISTSSHEALRCARPSREYAACAAVESLRVTRLARKLHDEARAAGTRVERDRAVRALDGALDDRQAEARAGNVALRSAVEAIEDARGIGRRYPGPSIGDLDDGA